MTLRDFIDKAQIQLDERGVAALKPLMSDFTFSALSRVPIVPSIGTNIFEREWDVCLILDACRLDMYQEHIDPDVGSIWSVGSSSNEWMQHTFTDDYREELAETIYITGNPFSNNECPAHLFNAVDEIWKTHWDDDLGTIRPEPITDRAINAARETDGRVLVHYMQPHYPFLNAPDLAGEMGWKTDVGDRLALWDQFLYGVRSDLDELERAYDDNLTTVWKDVQRLMNNVDGTVAVTADHGNAMGEFGMWGHKPGMPHPQMRRVPWKTYECSDTGDDILLNESNETSDVVEERLADLGYK